MATADPGEGVDDSTMDQLENSIVQEFQNLKVLTAFNYDQMDDLVRDLTNALDDSVKQKDTYKKEEASRSSNRRNCSSTHKKVKRKSKKRKSTAKDSIHSDATESSLDEALKDYLENITQQSDSDDWILSKKCLPSFTSITKQAVPPVESDSFTENFSPMQPHRHRRRKFKRMAVDLSSENDVLSNDILSKVNPQVKSLKTHLTSSDNIMDDDSRSRSPVTPSTSNETLPGKRKRGIRGCGNSFEVDPTNDECCNPCTEGSSSMEYDSKESTSSLSSSECSEARLTGDEGQEGDDEQSDFFHEPGPASGIPGIIPWWENEHVGEPPDKDTHFEQILTGSFEHMSQAAQRSFKTRLKQLTKPGREYRSARRCLKDRLLTACSHLGNAKSQKSNWRPDYSLSRFLQDRQRWTDSCGKKHHGSSNSGSSPTTTWYSSSNGVTSGADTKRRRKTPPTTPTPEDMNGEHGDPIPESNIGSRILQNMGWTPGSGLGADGLGIKTPIMPHRNKGRKGLGAMASAKS